MKTRLIRLGRVGALAFSVVVLAACGGGGGGDNGASSSVAASPGVSSGPSNPISASASSMPLEVMGTSTATVTVTVPASSGANATRLWMQVNNLAFDKEASVQVNSGPWVDVANANATVEGNAKAYGGIGGGYSTISLSVPVSGAVNGNNVVRFRYNGTNGLVSGYRVLAFNLRDGSGNSLIPATVFAQDDPTRWSAPLNDAADIAAGAQLWRSATLMGENGSGAIQQIKAHCMDCHTVDGRDLHQFNYSNFSIESRAQFHGLNSQQGQQIASYIRSLSTTQGTPGANCRPWNPPYQPGPGLDSQPIANWSCGAGLGAVSENDLDSLKYVFPNGINKQAIAVTGQLNQRNIPIGLQLPDWNHWLPRVHPMDAWGSYFTSSNLDKEYAGDGTGTATYNMRTQLQNGGAAYVTSPTSSFKTDYYYWGVELGERFAPPNEGTPNAYTIPQQVNIYSTLQWQLVKNWELAQDFKLETLCPQAYANAGSPKVEPRSWCGLWRFAFNLSPHALDFPPANSMFGSTVAHDYFANAWYEIQLQLNSGSGMHSEQQPVDWQYAYGVATDLQNTSGRAEPIRNLIYVVKGAQEMANGVSVANVDSGWTFRDTSPLDVWKGNQSTPLWNGVDASTKQAVLNAYLGTWLDYSSTFPASEWQRIDQAGGSNWCGWSERRLCWADYIPGQLRGAAPLTTVNFATDSFTDIPLMRADGVDGSLLNSYATLMNSLYTSGGFLGLLH